MIWLHDQREIESGGGLTDYKFYCFNGQAKVMMMATGRFSPNGKRFDYFDRSGKWLDVEWDCLHSEVEPKKPEQFEELFELVERLATGLPHIRIDLYIAEGHVYFGEMTFYDGSGFEKLTPQKWDYEFGEWIELPERRKSY